MKRPKIRHPFGRQRGDYYLATDIDPLLDELERLNLELRDQFAMSALTGLLADDTGLTPLELANLAYEFADKMLEARK